ncbi:uncharacterized protein [Zea mays]|uniref:uncharacterized protein n=1 Tax=Zea mays TaxID=4577 RepID=UPI0016533521|nr:uncharacterized protein LOC103639909 [Zea mays]
MALRHEGEAEGEWPDHQQAARAKGRGDHQRTSTTMEGTQMAMSRMWTRLPHPTRGQKKLERLQRSDFDAKHQSSVNADALRLQTLHRLPQILTVRQSARCFLAIDDYSHRLRALNELWHTRQGHEPAASTQAAGPSQTCCREQAYSSPCRIGLLSGAGVFLLRLLAVSSLNHEQAMSVCGVQQWARDAEAALDHELQAMHSSVSEAISSDAAALLYPYSDVPGFMATMSLAISKLASLEAFVRQADALRLQTLHRLPQILTARQSARCFLAIADYSHRLRARSELWHTRQGHEPAATCKIFVCHHVSI